jgi:hypothetical protein
MCMVDVEGVMLIYLTKPHAPPSTSCPPLQAVICMLRFPSFQVAEHITQVVCRIGAAYHEFPGPQSSGAKEGVRI